jgi:sulfopyruvate decarboxylase subunit alpha
MAIRENHAVMIVDALKAAGINYVVYLPDSFFFHALKLIDNDPEITSISVSNESTGLCMCAGAWLGGKKPAMIMENTGLLVCCYCITRLHNLFGIPVLLLVSYRGDVGDGFWWSPPLGRATEPVLRGLQIPYVGVWNIDEARDAIIGSQRCLDVADELRAVLFRGVDPW